MQFGTILALALSGILAANINWESIFYVFGGAGCCWFVLWVIFVFDTPASHPRISEVNTRHSFYISVRIPIHSFPGGKKIHPRKTSIQKWRLQPAKPTLEGNPNITASVFPDFHANCEQLWNLYHYEHGSHLLEQHSACLNILSKNSAPQQKVYTTSIWSHIFSLCRMVFYLLYLISSCGYCPFLLASLQTFW